MKTTIAINIDRLEAEMLLYGLKFVDWVPPGGTENALRKKLTNALDVLNHELPELPEDTFFPYGEYDPNYDGEYREENDGCDDLREIAEADRRRRIAVSP